MKKNSEIKKPISRIQTAKIRKALESTFFNIKSKKKNLLNRPLTSFHDTKISQLYLPPSEINSVKVSKNNVKNEYQKAHLNEINIHNLFTEKLWEKNNMEKNEDFTKKLAYKKLIMRARLLKAMKTNIVLRRQEFDEYNSKYYKGNKLLSAKLRKKQLKENEDLSSDSDNAKTNKERPNFNSIKTPDIFSEYEYTSLFQDYFCTPIDIITNIFDNDEQKIIKLDPLFFRLNKEPFIGIQKNFGFNLKDKINEEDKIMEQKIQKAKELNKKFFYVKRKYTTRKSTKTAEENSIKSEKNETNVKMIYEKGKKEKKSPPIEGKKYFLNSKFIFPYTDNSKKNRNKKNDIIYNFFPLTRTKSKSSQKSKLKINLSSTKKKKNDINLNLHTDYNVYLEMKKNKKRKINNQQISTFLYSDEEKIKDKKKRMSLEELMEIYNERKKLYLEDMSYNRKKNKYKFEQLRIKKYEKNVKENQKKNNLRKLLVEIEQNYKALYQK